MNAGFNLSINEIQSKYIKEEGNKNIEVSKKAWKIIKKVGLKSLFRKADVMICGGSLLSMFTKQTISDLDIYFTNTSTLTRFYNEIKVIPDAVLLSETDLYSTFKIKTKTIQLIKTVFGTPTEILEKFDFTICQICYVPKTDTFFMHRNFHEHVKSKVISINPNMPYPMSSLVRVGKYLNRGYVLNGDQAMLLGVLINNIKLDNYSSLKENVSGIYSDAPVELMSMEDKMYSPIDIVEIADLVDN